jgi:hypothetical protein
MHWFFVLNDAKKKLTQAKAGALLRAADCEAAAPASFGSRVRRNGPARKFP